MVTADYFDQWYADIDASPLRRQIFAEELGLPPEVEPSNMVPLEGLEELARVVAVPADGLLVDLACGRGGPGMWLARASGSRLVGIDFSPVAVAQAAGRVDRFGLDGRASFAVGSLDATGLPADSADAVVCVDAFQFASDSFAAASEVRRVLRPGGRVALTSWQAIDPSDERVPPRMRALDLSAALSGAGFLDVAVEDRPSWRAAERRFWDRALATAVDGDPAIQSLHDEAASTLPAWDAVRRVLATGRAPL